MKTRFLFLFLLLAGSTGFAQTACDSLIFQSILYQPFSDSLLEIRVSNTSSNIFSYPGFAILNSGGDTVAKETVVYYGIGTDYVHLLKIFPANLPAGTFSGTLQLYTWFYDTLACSWPMTFSLCPDSCRKVYPYLSDQSFAGVSGSFPWHITDSSGAVTLASGVFQINGSYAIDSVCLPPGAYRYFADSTTTVSGNFTAGLLPDPVVVYGNGPYITGSAPQLALDFSMYRACQSSTGTAPLPFSDKARIWSDGRQLHVRLNGKAAQASLVLYAMDGRAVYRAPVSSNSVDFDLSMLAPGLYVAGISGPQEAMQVLISVR